MIMRITFEERFKYLSICTKKKEILITYWGDLKFTKTVMHSGS